MRLIHLETINYKRLRGTHGMNVDPTVVCIVGPNEAGKSSFLNAFTRLNDDHDFDVTERTRSAPDGHAIQVRARFVLEDDDRTRLEDVPEASGVRQALVWKRSGSRRGFALEPVPERDLSLRKAS